MVPLPGSGCADEHRLYILQCGMRYPFAYRFQVKGWPPLAIFSPIACGDLVSA